MNASIAETSNTQTGVMIEGISKPKSCNGCWFNHADCWCSITHGGIDRDDYSCDKPCPISNKSVAEIRQMIDDISGYLHLADFDQVELTPAEYNDKTQTSKTKFN